MTNPSLSQMFFNLCNLAVGVMMLVSGVTKLIDADKFVPFMTAIYVILFGLLTFIVEVSGISHLTTYCFFMCTWIGRAMFYAFCGAVVIEGKGLELATGVLILCIALLWFSLGFINIYYPPAAIIGGVYGAPPAAYPSRRPAATTTTAASQPTHPPKAQTQRPERSSAAAPPSRTTAGKGRYEGNGNNSNGPSVDYTRPAGYSAETKKEGLNTRVGRG